MPRIPQLLLAALCLFFLSCQRSNDQIQTYRVSKENSSALHSTQHSSSNPRSKEIEWTVPAGWIEQTPSEMRLGSFLVKGEEGKTADVSVIPLTGVAGGNLANVNRWRGQINLLPMTEQELAHQSQILKTDGRSMLLVDFSHQKQRLVAAIYVRGNRTWFFKMLGDTATVQDAKPAFLQFLKSLRFHV